PGYMPPGACCGRCRMNVRYRPVLRE
ncbi:hypothetical protein AZZ66_004833, partial [Escherichia coli]